MFQVDRECYIVYMGTAGHDVRPFLRIGTTAFLPEQIKRHIGSVVITDRLTGNFLLEADCLAPRIIRHIRYVGTPQLLDAVKHYAHGEQIGSIDLEPVPERVPNQGGRVVFYDDGNLRVFLDGHRLFDLSQRERGDRHSIFRVERMDSIVSTSRGSYREEDFRNPGFIVDGNGSVAIFAGGRLFLKRHSEGHGLAEWALKGVPLSFIQGAGDAVPSDVYVQLYRLLLVRRRPVFHTKPDPPGIDVFRAAGLEITGESPPDLPDAAPGTTGSDWVLPEGEGWHHNTQPPLLAGVPYRYDDSPPELDFRHLMTKELQKRVDSAKDADSVLTAIAGDVDVPPIDRVCSAFWLWNRTFTKDAREGILSAFRRSFLPVIGLIRKDGPHWRVRFRPRPGLSRSAAGDNEKAREKIMPYTVTETDDSAYQRERERLLAFLQQMVATGHSREPAGKTPVPPAPSTEGESDSTAAVAHDTPAQSGNTSGATRSTKAPMSTKRSTTGQSSTTRAYLPLLILVLLLLGIGGAFLVNRFSQGNESSHTAADTPVTETPAVIVPATDKTLPASAEEQQTETVAPREDNSGTTVVSESPEVAVAPSPSEGDLRTVPAGTDDNNNSDRSENAPVSDSITPTTPSPWTVQDVLRVTNWIAGANGFRPIGAKDIENRRDPDWIFPGNIFRLPDDRAQTVVAGDTLWSISESFLNQLFLASNMELSHFRDLIDSDEYPVDELKRIRR